MRQHRFCKHLIVAGLAVFVFTSIAEAVVIHYFPIFGIVNGVQTARINAVLQAPPDSDLPCPVSLVFIDSQGRSIGDPNIFQLRGGAAVGVDFVGNPDALFGERLEIRALVTYPTQPTPFGNADPNQFPGCAAGVLTSVEVVDRRTRSTQIILTNPVVQGPRLF
jgi:hypothetical protein